MIIKHSTAVSLLPKVQRRGSGGQQHLVRNPQMGQALPTKQPQRVAHAEHVQRCHGSMQQARVRHRSCSTYSSTCTAWVWCTARSPPEFRWRRVKRRLPIWLTRLSSPPSLPQRLHDVRVAPSLLLGADVALAAAGEGRHQVVGVQLVHVHHF